MFRKMLILLSLTGIILSGCRKDGDPKPNEREVNFGKLTTVWKVSAVTLDGDVAPGDYSNFELALIGSPEDATYLYISTGRPALSPWMGSGTWNFGADVASQLVRDAGTIDELPVNYTVTDSELVLTFSFGGDGYASSRIATVSGNWSFTFSKK